MQGFASLLTPQAGLRKWQLEVPFLTSWVYCFLAYIVVQTSEAATRNMLVYCCLIIHEALHHGGRDGRSVIGHFGDSRKSANSCPGTHCWLTYRHLQYWDKDKMAHFVPPVRVLTTQIISVLTPTRIFGTHDWRGFGLVPSHVKKSWPAVITSLQFLEF